MSSLESASITEALFELFWQSLEGGDYDIDELRSRFLDTSTFQEFLIDSLDLTDFLLRVKDHFQVQVPLENLPSLDSLKAVAAYIREYQAAHAVPIADVSLQHR